MVDYQFVQELVVLGLSAVDHQQVAQGVHGVAVPRQWLLASGLNLLPTQRANVLKVHHPQIIQVMAE